MNTSHISESWIKTEANEDFTIFNIPFGVFTTGGQSPRVGSAIGAYVIDLAALAEKEYFNGLNLPANVFEAASLNDFIQLGKKTTTAVRNRIIELFDVNNGELRDNEAAKNDVLIARDSVKMLLPVQIGDYTDFYSSIEHATNVGTMFRDPDNALLPNWKHIPVGYHGRASSIIVSETDIHRPKGQTRPNDEEPPTFGPSKLLDFELEMAFITYPGKPLGQAITTAEADEYIFGMVVFNDWSARDIQKWEYVPLGPFLAKNFASSLSPWVVTLDALEQFRTAGPVQNPAVLPYLETEPNKNIDIQLEVAIEPLNAEENVVCRSNYKYMYWNMNQQLAHQTVNGCNINAGDLYASGTISGPTPDSYGSMLELSWKGTKPIPMSDGTERKFINDHDTVIMRAHCEKDNRRVGFGEVRTKVLPAL